MKRKKTVIYKKRTHMRMGSGAGGPVDPPIDPDPPVADFIGDVLSGTAPLLVTFTDLSTNVPTSWYWTFGDGFDASSQNPQHSYETNGTFTVALQASNFGGSDTETKVGYITVADVAFVWSYDFTEPANSFYLTTF